MTLTAPQRAMLDRLTAEPHFYNGPATHVLRALRDMGLAERTEPAHDGGYWRVTAAGAALQTARPQHGRDPLSAFYGPSNESVSRYEREVIASQLRGSR